MITHAIITGIVGWVFCLILIDEGMIFEKWWNIINRLPMWLSKPLGSCEFCFTGQLALWYYLYFAWRTDAYNAFYHIAFISIAILTVKMINVIIYGNEGE